MITIFTLPKPFTDPHIRTIQRNALLSWKNLHPDVEVLVMGKDPGIKETTEEFGLTWIPEVSVNEFGTPLLDSAFSLARQKAKYETIMYVNADIIFVSDLLETLPKLPKNDALTVGRRIDFDITGEINFTDPQWENRLEKEIEEKGSLHSYAGIDYFIFNKNLLQNLPPFAVGRVGWDNWTVRESRRVNKYTIDATECITAIHENHGYSGNNTGTQRKTNPEAVRNNSFIKKRGQGFTIEDANWKLVRSGKRIKLERNWFCSLPFIKRWVKSFLWFQ